MQGHAIVLLYNFTVTRWLSFHHAPLFSYQYKTINSGYSLIFFPIFELMNKNSAGKL